MGSLGTIRKILKDPLFVKPIALIIIGVWFFFLFQLVTSLKQTNRDPCGSCEKLIGLECDSVIIEDANCTLTCDNSIYRNYNACEVNRTLCLPNSTESYFKSRELVLDVP